MAVKDYDLFAGTSGTSLSGRVANSGRTWGGANPANIVLNGSGQVASSTLAQNVPTLGTYSAGAPTGLGVYGDAQAAAVVMHGPAGFGTGSPDIEIVLRFQDASNYISCGLASEHTTVEIFRTVAGTTTGSGANVALPSAPSATARTLAFGIDASNNYTIVVDGTTIGTGTVSGIVLPGTGGYIAGPPGFRNAQAASNGYSISNYMAGDSVADLATLITALTAGTVATGTPTSTTVPLTYSGTTGSVGPFAVQFQQAPDASGSPGTYANIGSAITGVASGAPSNFTATGLTSGATLWFRAIATDEFGVNTTSAGVSAIVGSTPTATGYTLAMSASTTPIGTALTATATLTGPGTTLTSQLVITVADDHGSTIGGTITINNGSTTGTATVNPTVVGLHAITGAHTGGGFTGGDGSTSFTATTSYASPPADPQLLLTGPLATTLQSMVFLGNTASGFGRNLVNNALPISFSGASFLNGGEDPLKIASDFTPDATPAATLRMAVNSRSKSWPYGGVAAGTVRTGNNNDRTYFGIGKVERIDRPVNSQYPIFGQMFSVYDLAYNGTPGTEGIGIVQIGSNGYLSFFDTAATTLICTDVTGATPQCQVIPDHWYFWFVSASDVTSPNSDGQLYTRFGLFDLNTWAEISPPGNQYTMANGSLLSSANSRRVNAAVIGTSGTVADLVLHQDAGLIHRARMIGIDNKLWGNGGAGGVTIGPAAPGGIVGANLLQQFTTNPYFMTTATVNSAGTPPATLYDPTGGETLYQASSGFSGVPASLPLVTPGDFAITAVNQTRAILQVTAPLGAPHPISTYSWFTSPTYAGSGTLISATGTTSSLSYTIPDAALHYVWATATDSVGTVYTYKRLPLYRKSRQAVKTILLGNSVFQIGHVTNIMQTMVAVGQALGFDVVVSAQGVSSSVFGDFNPGSPTTQNYYGIGGGAVNSSNWAMMGAARELAVTGAPFDQIALRVSENSYTISSAAYLAFAQQFLNGTSVGGPAIAGAPGAIACVNFCAGLWLHGTHTYTDNAGTVASEAFADAIANGSTIITTGRGPQQISQTFIWDMAGGHPNQFLGMAEGYSILTELPTVKAMFSTGTTGGFRQVGYNGGIS